MSLVRKQEQPIPVPKRRGERYWDRAVRFLTGHDVFISYSREDGRWYATELAKILANSGLACLFDRWWTRPGKRIPLKLKVGIRRSALAIVVVTPCSADSPHVGEEIDEFLATGRSPILIDIGKSVQTAMWREAVGGLPVELEHFDVADLKSAKPSLEVLARIEGACGFATREQRLAQTAKALGGVLALLLLLAGGAWWVGNQRASEARAAQAARRLAESETVRQKAAATAAAILAQTNAGEAIAAEGRLISTTKDLDAANRQYQTVSASNTRLQATEQQLNNDVERVGRDLIGAQNLAAQQTQAADKAAHDAEEAGKARQSAENARILALRGTFEAHAARIQSAKWDRDEIRQSVIDTIDDYAQLKPENDAIPASLHTALTDAAVKTRLTGRVLGVGAYPRVSDFGTAPRRHLLLTAGVVTPNEPAESALTLWDPAENRAVAELDRTTKTEITTCAFSPDENLIAAGYKDGSLRLFEWKNGRFEATAWSVRIAPIQRLRFSPSGKRLLVWAAQPDSQEMPLYLVQPHGESTPLFADRPKFTRPVFEVHDERTADTLFHSALPAIAAIWDERRDPKSGDIWPRLRSVETDTGTELDWDLDKPALRRLLPRGVSPFAVPVISPDHRWLLIAAPDNDFIQHGTLLVDLECWNATRAGCTALRRFPKIVTQSEYLRAGFSPDARFLVVSAGDGQYPVYDLNALARGVQEPSTVVQGGREFLGFTHDGHGAIFFSQTAWHASTFDLIMNDGPNGPEMEIWPLNGRTGPSVFSVPSAPLEFFHREAMDLGAFVIAGPRAQGQLAILENHSSAGHVLETHHEGIELGSATDATGSPDGAWIGTVHKSNRVGIWRAREGQLRAVLNGFRGDLAGLHWAHSKEPMLFAASVDGDVVRWSPGRGLENLNPPSSLHEVDDLQISNDGTVAAIHFKNGRIALFADGHWQIFPFTAETFALAESGRLIATANDRGGAEIRDVKGTTTAVLNPPKPGLLALKLRFALGDSRLVAEGAGPTIWDTRGGDPLVSGLSPKVKTDTISHPDVSALWVADSKNTTSTIDLRSGRTLAQIQGRDSLAEGASFLIQSVSIFDIASSTQLAVSVSGRSRAAESPEAKVWDLVSGTVLGYLPVNHLSKRIEFLPDGHEVLFVSPDGHPIIAAVDLTSRIRELCPVVYSEFWPAELQRKPAAFAYCVYVSRDFAKAPGNPATEAPKVFEVGSRKAGLAAGGAFVPANKK